MTNPFRPTVIINGSVLYSDPSTLPSSYADSDVFIQLNSAGAIGGGNLCDIYSINWNLDYSGGRWAISTGSQWTLEGSNVTFFGLQGACTGEGPRVDNSMIGRDSSGIFATLRAHQQLNILLYGTIANQLLTGQSLSQTSSNNFLTVESVARIIANQIGVQLNWMVNDVPYAQLNLSGTSTGIAAIQQLAALQSAVARWDGINTITVAYPDQTIGSWVVPDCRLLAAGGARGQNLWDLETGISPINQSARVIPQYGTNLNNYGTSNLQSFGPPSSTQKVQANPRIEQWKSLQKYPDVNDPDIWFDLPINYDLIFCQIVVPPGFNTGDPYVTDDPSVWTLYSPAGTIQVIGRNGIYVPQFLVNSATMGNADANAAVANGNFIINYGISRKSLKSQYKSTATSTNDGSLGGTGTSYQQLRLNKDLFTYIKVYRGTIQCLFFGSIPLPGMFVSATAGNGVTVSGICESVSFAAPGILTIQVARYVRANFSYPIQNMNVKQIQGSQPTNSGTFNSGGTFNSQGVFNSSGTFNSQGTFQP